MNKSNIEIVSADGVPKGNASIISKFYISYLLVTGWSLLETFETKEEKDTRLAEVKGTLLKKSKEELPMFMEVNGEIVQLETIQNIMDGRPMLQEKA